MAWVDFSALPTTAAPSFAERPKRDAGGAWQPEWSALQARVPYHAIARWEPCFLYHGEAPIRRESGFTRVHFVGEASHPSVVVGLPVQEFDALMSEVVDGEPLRVSR